EQRAQAGYGVVARKELWEHVHPAGRSREDDVLGDRRLGQLCRCRRRADDLQPIGLGELLDTAGARDRGGGPPAPPPPAPQAGRGAPPAWPIRGMKRSRDCSTGISMPRSSTTNSRSPARSKTAPKSAPIAVTSRRACPMDSRSDDSDAAVSVVNPCAETASRF